MDYATKDQLTFIFILTLFIVLFQLFAHLSETRDLQRRVGQLEQQVNRQ